MTNRKLSTAGFAVLLVLLTSTLRGDETPRTVPVWPQWRGPTRDGQVQGSAWPDNLRKDTLKQRWRVELGPSYSGPIVAPDRVFVTETRDKKTEVVRAFDRKTGKELWRAEWSGAIAVPFFAASNGSWIRSTPALDADSLFAAGMRDVLVSLNAKTGKEQWRVDFVKEFKATLPAFGFVSSPLVDGDAVYVQAGASFVKLDKTNGKVVWRVLKDDGGMMGSAFSSPTIATLAGQRQILVQAREKLVGVDPETGDILWKQNVPNFRGMNILTPVSFGDAVFTSSYNNKSWLYAVSKKDQKFQVKEAWSNNAQGYMSTPVVSDGHAYLHMQNQLGYDAGDEPDNGFHDRPGWRQGDDGHRRIDCAGVIGGSASGTGESRGDCGGKGRRYRPDIGRGSFLCGPGIRVNCVTPGLVRTPLTARLTASEASLKASTAMHPLGRIGEPGDVASAIAWLLDPQWRWVTGQVFGIDRGLATLRARGGA